MLCPFETLFKIYSWTELLSWYSSISISLKSYFLAVSVGFPSSSTNIFKAKCSMSLKSTIFFSLFLFANSFSNFKTRFCIAFSVVCISFMSLTVSFEFVLTSFCISIKFALAKSLIALALSFASFSSSDILLFLGQVCHSFEFKSWYNLSHILFWFFSLLFSSNNEICSVFSALSHERFDISICSISCKSVFKTDIKSIKFGYVSTSWIADSKFILQSSKVSFALSTIILPQSVFEKSETIFVSFDFCKLASSFGKTSSNFTFSIFDFSSYLIL